MAKTLSILEAKYNLEPIPVKDAPSPPSESETFRPRPPLPFVSAYEKSEYFPYDLFPKELEAVKGLRKLSWMIKTTNICALSEIERTNDYLDNFYQRLQRLEPLIETAAKQKGN